MKEIELLFKVAQMYYEQGLTQDQIGKKLFVSRSNVSRLLKQAEEVGIVEIKIHYPTERRRRSEQHLHQLFGMEEIRVLDTTSESPFDRFTATTKLAASWLNSQLKSDSILAITCGNSVCGTVHELRPREYLPQMIVASLMGSIESSNVILDGHYLVRYMADTYGCRHHYIMAPFYVEEPNVRRSLMEHPSIRETIMIAEHATIMLTGIGHDFSLNYMPKSEQAKEEMGAVGYIAGLYYDRDGKIIDMPAAYDCEIGAGTRLFDIPLRCAVVADDAKAEATLGALQGGLINVLITNTTVVDRIHELMKERGLPGAGDTADES